MATKSFNASQFGYIAAEDFVAYRRASTVSRKLIAGILEHWFADTNETEVWSGKSRTTTWNIDGNVYMFHDGEKSAAGHEASGTLQPAHYLETPASGQLSV